MTGADQLQLTVRTNKIEVTGARKNKNEAVLVREFRKDLLSWLPELDGAPELLEAADVALSFETWDRLRCQQRLSQARTRDTMERLLTALIAELGHEQTRDVTSADRRHDAKPQ